MPKDTFTPRELDVMSILWDLNSATVAEVRDRMTDPLAYTTVLSALQTLEEKRYVGHEPAGRAYRYHPLVDWKTAGGRELRRILGKVFKGSPELLLVQLVSDGRLKPSELRRIRDLIEDRLGEDHGERDDRGQSGEKEG